MILKKYTDKMTFIQKLLVAICHIQSSYNIIDYISCEVHYILMAYLFYNF